MTLPTRVKINVLLSAEDVDPSVESENLWAKPLSNGNFKIDSIPFHIYGLSLDDEVSAKVSEGRLCFDTIKSRSGHSTYRLFLSEKGVNEPEEVIRFWSRLEELGCQRELAGRRVVSVDVPPESDIFAIFRILEAAENGGLWSFEEAHCGHPKVKVVSHEATIDRRPD
jgi:hypothetical protein